MGPAAIKLYDKQALVLRIETTVTASKRAATLAEETLLGQAQLYEQVVRDFTRQFNLLMRNLEAECPNIFYVMPADRRVFDPRDWTGHSYDLYLVCQHPPKPHQVLQSYRLKKSEEWWKTVSPWLGRLGKLLKVGVPIVSNLVNVVVEATDSPGKADTAILESVSATLRRETEGKLLESITSALGESTILEPAEIYDEGDSLARYQEAYGPALRALYAFLHKEDPDHHWGGLQKVATPDGNIFWLCAEHAAPYLPKTPLIDIGV